MKLINKKGLTLVELLAVIVVLAVVALIATPNILKAISKYHNRLYDTQLDNIKSAAKNWAADRIDNYGCLVCVAPDNVYAYNCSEIGSGCVEAEKDSGESMSVTVAVLEDGGYIDDELTNPKTEEKFNRCVEVIITINPDTGDYIYSIPDPDITDSCSL